jgi:hypothetical protein
MSEVEDSPRIDRVIQERSRNKGKRMSFSDDEFDKSSGEFVWYSYPNPFRYRYLLFRKENTRSNLAYLKHGSSQKPHPELSCIQTVGCAFIVQSSSVSYL